MMPSCDHTGVPGCVDFTHFHSSTMSGSASLMSLRILPRVFPRQSPSSLILSSIDAAADSTGTVLFMYTSHSRILAVLSVACNLRKLKPLPPSLQPFGALGVHPGVSTPNCFAYSAFNRCQPPNFIAPGPTMRPMGRPARSRSSTSKQMCQPAAPIDMNPRSMLCESVSRVPPPSGGSSSPRMSCPPPAEFEHLGRVGPLHLGLGYMRRRRP